MLGIEPGFLQPPAHSLVTISTELFRFPLQAEDEAENEGDLSQPVSFVL
jgi:hypothetical protein